MSAADAPPRPDSESARSGGRVSTARIVVALVLLAIGILWLLDGTNVVDVPWGALLPAALIVVGIALIAGARTARHGGLIALGVGLTIVLAFTTLVSVPLEGGIGEQVERPASADQIRGRYRLAFGSLTIDLTAVEFPEGDTTVDVRVGMGELVMTVPEGVALEVRGRITGGQMVVLDEERSGFQVEHTFTFDSDGGGSRLIIDLEMGFGSARIQRGAG